MKELSIIWKWRVLTASLVLLCIAAYYFNFRKTIELVSIVRSQTNMLNEQKSRSYELPTLDERNISKSSYTYNQGFDSFLYNLTSYCDSFSVNICTINQEYQHNDSLKIELNKITVEGSYEDILHLIYAIEREEKINPINSMSFELTKSKHNTDYSLTSVMYIKRLLHEN